MKKKLYTPKKQPMSIAFFVSGGGGNLQAALDLSEKFPDKLSVDLVISDRLNIPAIQIANNRNIPVISKDFDRICGLSSYLQKGKHNINYQKNAEHLHNEILEEIKQFEFLRGYKIDLAVLSYHRWIQGDLLHYFKDRMINQHPADLSVLDENFKRKYIGLNGVQAALLDKQSFTRTTTFLVKEGFDNGEILCMGPKVEFHETTINLKNIIAQEQVQKEKSDWPSLKFALYHISNGDFEICENKKHHDSSRTIYFLEKELPYRGVPIENDIIF
ncbi:MULTISPECIES: formyltransferase family protein [Bacillus cereus group]|uniref:phosphoribosylglycinamide formyltransferase 1 n=1 Tax=Bacillus proteolyticus TaxID=2026192 RepID=A0ABV3IF90_9BACI|nr:formyltransferase family protein [Bacillus cereus group sp. N8]MBJ8107558.1 hypothetical protein [Bacillus cereus group sp. N8]